MIKIKLNSILVLIVITIAITACKKDEIFYRFDGVVTNSIDKASLAGVKVTLSQKVVKNGSTSVNYSEVVYLTTLADGKYGFTIAREMVTSFKFDFEADNFFDVERIETSANVTTDGFNTFNQELEPRSWIQFDIENLFANETDHFKFITHNFREDCLGCAENKTVDFYGELDTLMNYVTTGGEYVRFTYINVSTGASHTDSIFANPFETQVYPINY